VRTKIGRTMVKFGSFSKEALPGIMERYLGEGAEKGLATTFVIGLLCYFLTLFVRSLLRLKQ
jgi:hypothetical protein